MKLFFRIILITIFSIGIIRLNQSFLSLFISRPKISTVPNDMNRSSKIKFPPSIAMQLQQSVNRSPISPNQFQSKVSLVSSHQFQSKVLLPCMLILPTNGMNSRTVVQKILALPSIDTLQKSPLHFFCFYDIIRLICSFVRYLTYPLFDLSDKQKSWLRKSNDFPIDMKKKSPSKHRRFLSFFSI